MQVKSLFPLRKAIPETLRYSLEASQATTRTVFAETTPALPTVEQETLHHDTGSTGDNSYRVILYNDDWHTVDQVALQLQKATGCTIEEAMAVIWAVELRGRAVCFRGSRDDCHRVTRVLREIRLQCEVDCD